MRGWLWAGLVALALSPQAASAATITGEQTGDHTIFVYEAAPGEVNAPQVSFTRSAMTIVDAGVTITSDDRCEASGDRVTCRFDRLFDELRVNLGDADDTFDLALEPGDFRLASVKAGPGDDSVEASTRVIDGGDGGDSLTSDRPEARLSGGRGADSLTGGESFQVLAGGPGADTIDGNLGAPGEVTETIVGVAVSFADATAPVTADLGALGPMGPAAEPDTVSRVDGVIGGRADDVLTGTADRNEIRGGPGDDEIGAGAGNDDISPGPGADSVLGGAGADRIVDGREKTTPGGLLDGGAGADDIRALGSGAEVTGGSGSDDLEVDAAVPSADGGAGNDDVVAREELVDTSRFTCGEGNDTAVDFRRGRVPADCERVGFPHPKVGTSVPNRVALDGTRLRVLVPNLCGGECPTRVQLFLAERVVASVTVDIGPAASRGQAVLTVTAAVARRLRREEAVTVFVSSPRSFNEDTFATFGAIE